MLLLRLLNKVPHFPTPLSLFYAFVYRRSYTILKLFCIYGVTLDSGTPDHKTRQPALLGPSDEKQQRLKKQERVFRPGGKGNKPYPCDQIDDNSGDYCTY